MNFERQVLYAKQAKDKTFGEYPFLLVDYTFITRDNILSFLNEVHRIASME